jgi:hypothetical protein
MAKHTVVSKAVAEKICSNEGLILSDVVKEAQLLKSGAKLKYRKPRYYIAGYAESGIDVETTLSNVV